MHVSLWGRAYARNHKEHNSDAYDGILYAAMRGNMNLETPAVSFSTWMCVRVTESWDDRTCSVVVIWTRRNWQLAEHPRCDETRERRKHARGKNIRGEKREEMNPLSSYSSHACHQSRVACSVVSTFSERHAYSRCTEDRKCFKLRRIASLILSTI